MNRVLGRTLGPLTGRQTTGRLQKTVQPSDLHSCHSSSIIKKEMNRRGMQHASMLCNVPLYLENQKRPRGNFRHVWQHIKANSEQNGWEDTDWIEVPAVGNIKAPQKCDQFLHQLSACQLLNDSSIPRSNSVADYALFCNASSYLGTARSLFQNRFNKMRQTTRLYCTTAVYTHLSSNIPQ